MLQKKPNVALNRAGIELAFVLASIPCDPQLVVCFGAHAMRVRCCSIHPRLLVFDVRVGQLCVHGHLPASPAVLHLTDNFPCIYDFPE